MTVIKRKQGSSVQELITSIDEFNGLLSSQGEDEAVAILKQAQDDLKKSDPEAHKKAAAAIIDAFEGDQELMAYTFQRDQEGEWTEAEELSQVSSRVFALARRVK